MCGLQMGMDVCMHFDLACQKQRLVRLHMHLSLPNPFLLVANFIRKMIEVKQCYSRERSETPTDPKFIVTLDGVDPSTYRVVPEERQPPYVQVKWFCQLKSANVGRNKIIYSCKVM